MMAPPEPGLAREIERIRRLEAADVIGWWEAAELIAQLEDGKRGTVHMLGHLPLIELQARFLLLLEPEERQVREEPRPPCPLPFSRDRLITAILDRVS